MKGEQAVEGDNWTSSHYLTAKSAKTRERHEQTFSRFSVLFAVLF
jgi:hypothetical protein